MAFKECVACAEDIKVNAKICRFCSADQSDPRYVESQVELGETQSTGEIDLRCIKCWEPLDNPGKFYCSNCLHDPSEPTHPFPIKTLPSRTTTKQSSGIGKFVFLALLLALGVWLFSTYGGDINFGFGSNGRESGTSTNTPDYSNMNGTDADFNLETDNAPSGHYEDVCQWVTKPGGGDSAGMDGNGHVATITVRECRQVWVED